MKQIIHIFVLFHCLICLANLNCFGSSNYAIQAATSKNPIDLKLFAEQYKIDKEVIEIKENGIYKYVIYGFENKKTASEYIAINLQPKGLINAFPRKLTERITESSKKETKLSSNTNSSRKDSVHSIVGNSVQKKNRNSKQSVYSNNVKKLDPQDPSEKFAVWNKLVGWKKLQYIEIKLINAAKVILPKSFLPFYVRIIDKAIRYPIILFFVLLIFLFILNAILIIVTLEISNNLKNQIERYHDLYQAMYERAMTGYIFQEYDLETTVHRLKKINRQRNRKIFVSVLFNFQKNLSGDSDQKILDIFFRLRLHIDSIKKTNSNSSYHQIVGIRELTNLYPSGALPVIEIHINDDNNEMRAEAQTSYVRLNIEEPFSFMRNLVKPFTSWTQLTAFYIFKLHKLPEPDFSEYLQSELHNVQNFSLKLITYFQQKENAEGIIKLIDSKVERTRFLVIKAINELRIQEAKPILKERFEKETYLNRLEIVKALLHIGDVEDFDFLEKIIRGKGISLKIEACRSMYFMNSLGIDNLVRLNQEKELNLDPYIAHIYDFRN